MVKATSILEKSSQREDHDAQISLDTRRAAVHTGCLVGPGCFCASGYTRSSGWHTGWQRQCERQRPQLQARGIELAAGAHRDGRDDRQRARVPDHAQHGDERPEAA